MILLPCKIDIFADTVCNKELAAIYVFMDMESNKKFPFCIKKFRWVRSNPYVNGCEAGRRGAFFKKQ